MKLSQDENFVSGDSQVFVDKSWSLEDEKLEAIIGLARSENSTSILEFGSGWSTVALALALPDRRIVSVEHDPEFFLKTQSLLEANGIVERVELRLCPLRLSPVHGRRSVTYAFDPGEEKFDFVVIDGPPRWAPRGREAVLTSIFDNLVIGSIVVLDDFHRREEQMAKVFWQRMYGPAITFDFGLETYSLLVTRIVSQRAKSTKSVRLLRRIVATFGQVMVAIRTMQLPLIRATPHGE